MRKWIWILGLLLVLGLRPPAWAQGWKSTFGGVRPDQIVNQPIDMSTAIAPPLARAPRLSPLTRFLSSFSLANILTPRRGTSTLPAPGTFPGVPVSSPIQPMPITYSNVR